jgi:MFS family permease
MHGQQAIAANLWWQRFDHRRLPALFLVALSGLYCMMNVNVLPSFVSAWVEQFGISDGASGEIATINLLAHASGVTLALFLVSRWPLRRMFLLGLVLAVLGDGSSVVAPNVLSLEFARAAAGLGLGMQFGAINNWIGRNENSERGFAVFIMLQFVCAAILFYFIPSVAPALGFASVYAVLVPLVILAVLLSPVLNLNGGNKALAIDRLHSASAKAVSGPLFVPRLLSVLAFALFSIGAIGLWGYMERYGLTAGFSNQSIAVALAVSSLCGVPGGLIVIALGTRYGRLIPLLASMAGFAATAAVFAFTAVKLPMFIAGLAVIGLAWNVVQPYLQGIQSGLDTTGRLPVAGMVVALVAGAFGPALVGHLADGQNYRLAFALALSSFVVAGLVAIAPAVVVDKRLTRSE